MPGGGGVMVGRPGNPVLDAGADSDSDEVDGGRLGVDPTRSREPTGGGG